MSATTTAGPEISDVSRPALMRQDSKAAAAAAAANGGGGGVDSRFCCNICLEAVVDPVATLCGHLYCWPCLFRWLEPGMYPGERASLGMMQQVLASDANRRVCPVCKAHCSVPTLVPIYVRESNESDAMTAFRPSLETNSSQQPQPPPQQQQRRLGESSLRSESMDGDGDRDSSDSESVTAQQQENNHSTLHNTTNSIEHDFNTTTNTNTMGVSGESITGLRQRLRFRSRDSENSVDTVPSRPPAQSPRHHHSPVSPSNNNHSNHNHNHNNSSTPPTPQRYGTSSWVAPLTPTGHRGSLTHGLLLSIQQATASGSSRVVPPLHRRDGSHPADLEAHAGASEYLSRLLLMLGCFVVLCLLLL